jgi:hypothetical protein
MSIGDRNPTQSTIQRLPHNIQHIPAPSPLAQASVRSPLTPQKERTRKLQVHMGLAASTTARISPRQQVSSRARPSPSTSLRERLQAHTRTRNPLQHIPPYLHHFPNSHAQPAAARTLRSAATLFLIVPSTPPSLWLPSTRLAPSGLACLHASLLASRPRRFARSRAKRPRTPALRSRRPQPLVRPFPQALSLIVLPAFAAHRHSPPACRATTPLPLPHQRTSPALSAAPTALTRCAGLANAPPAQMAPTASPH